MRGSETKLINLITLCYFHQRLVHERGWHVQVLEDGAFRFLRSKGESLDTSISKTPDSDASRITDHDRQANGAAIIFSKGRESLSIPPNGVSNRFSPLRTGSVPNCS